MAKNNKKVIVPKFDYNKFRTETIEKLQKCEDNTIGFNLASSLIDLAREDDDIDLYQIHDCMIELCDIYDDTEDKFGHKISPSVDAIFDRAKKDISLQYDSVYNKKALCMLLGIEYIQ